MGLSVLCRVGYLLIVFCSSGMKVRSEWDRVGRADVRVCERVLDEKRGSETGCLR